MKLELFYRMTLFLPNTTVKQKSHSQVWIHPFRLLAGCRGWAPCPPLTMYLAVHQFLWVEPSAEDTIELCSQNLEKSSWYWPGYLLPGGCCHRATGARLAARGEKKHQVLPSCEPVNYINDSPSKTHSLVLERMHTNTHTLKSIWKSPEKIDSKAIFLLLSLQIVHMF